MENIITVTIPEELTILIQRYDLEAKAAKEILTYLITIKDIDIADERIQIYLNNYNEKYYIFEVAKAELEQSYIMPKLKENQKLLNWNLNYYNNNITICYED